MSPFFNQKHVTDITHHRCSPFLLFPILLRKKIGLLAPATLDAFQSKKYVYKPSLVYPVWHTQFWIWVGQNQFWVGQKPKYWASLCLVIKLAQNLFSTYSDCRMKSTTDVTYITNSTFWTSFLRSRLFLFCSITFNNIILL